MIQVTPHMRILVAVRPVDFRNGLDGLARLCRAAMQADPMDGGVFVFRNRRGTAVKILAYDGQGLWLCQKRLSTGQFRWWPKPGQEDTIRLEAHQLQVLLWNGNPAAAQVPPAWRAVAIAGGHLAGAS